MAQDIGLLLRGLGAAFSNTVPQFRQEMAQEQEARYLQQQREQEAEYLRQQRDRQQQLFQNQQTEFQQAQQDRMAQMRESALQASYKDADAAMRALAVGDLDTVIAIAEDGIDAGKNIPGFDVTPYQKVLENARLAKAGNPRGWNDVRLNLLSAVSQGKARGYITEPEQAKGVVVNGRVVDPTTGRVIYESPASESMDEFSPGITRFRNGVAVQYSRQGNRRVLDERGNVVEGADAESAIRRGQQSGITEAGQTAAAQVQGRGASDRAQGIINAGVDATAQIPVLTRTLDLLSEVQTGGFAGAGIRAKALFGIEGADEGELSYNLAMNVLQQLKPIFGSAFTAGEGQRLERIEASLGRNTQTNIRLLNQALRVAQTSIEKGLDRAEEANDQATVRELQNALTLIDQRSVPEEWINMGGTVEAWNNLSDADKQEFLR